MQPITTLIIGWSPMVFLSAALLGSGWLASRSSGFSRTAEGLGWASLVSAFVGLVAWVVTGRGEWSMTLTDAGLIGVRINALSLTIFTLVAFLAAIILRYSKNYLAGDEKQGNFLKWMLFTLGAVMALVLSPGLVQFWLSWVAGSMGLHHLLVYFPDRLGTLLSARKKFLVSRLGDVCLIVSFIGIYHVFGTQNFSEIFSAASMEPALAESSGWIAWLIVAGAILKSAQFPFHTWLPDTMGTPTPVSALMHAGIINAGGYLVILMSPLLVETSSALMMLAVIGAITVAGGSLVMLTQTSIKRSLAFSTIAQMGFMLLQCGLGAFDLAALHLVAHSLYKAHAFLSSGSSVATIKRLEGGSKSALSVGALIGVTSLSVVLVAVLTWAFGLSIANKPGLLVFGVVLSMALAYFLINRLPLESSPRAFVRSVALAAAIVAIYLGLASFVRVWFAGAISHLQPVEIGFQAVIAVALFAFFLLTVALQANVGGIGQSRFARSLYIHALNGFYLNTIANRLARAVGLVPAGR